jgi:hypothetical protein
MGERTGVMRAVHSGQEVVNPDSEPVSMLIRRCHGSSPSHLPAIAQRRPASRSCLVVFHGPTAQTMAPGHQRSLPPPVPTDQVGEHGRGTRGRRASEAPVLEVRYVFETSRLGSACLATAYAQVVPGHQRRVGVGGQISGGLSLDAGWPQAVRSSGGIRDV